MLIDLAIDGRVFLETELDCAIQEIDLLFNTVNSELLGDVKYGTDWEQFLWMLTPTCSEIEKYIQNKINQYTYFASKFSVSVNAQYLRGDYSAVYLVAVTITDNSGNKKTKTYKLQ